MGIDQSQYKNASKILLQSIPGGSAAERNIRPTSNVYLLFDLEFLVGINLPRGDTIYSKNFIYYTSFNMNYNTDAVCCRL